MCPDVPNKFFHEACIDASVGTGVIPRLKEALEHCGNAYLYVANVNKTWRQAYGPSNNKHLCATPSRLYQGSAASWQLLHCNDSKQHRFLPRMGNWQ